MGSRSPHHRSCAARASPGRPERNARSRRTAFMFRYARMGDGVSHEPIGRATRERVTSPQPDRDRRSCRRRRPALHAHRCFPLLHRQGGTAERVHTYASASGQRRTAGVHPRQHGSLQVRHVVPAVHSREPRRGLLRALGVRAGDRYAGVPVRPSMVDANTRRLSETSQRRPIR